MLIQVLILIVSFIVLIKGADLFVDGAASFAHNLKISSLIIGLTVIAFGTSMPEFAVSFKAISGGNGDIVLGNVIGSCIANVFFVLGFASLFNDIRVKDNTVKKEIPIMALISMLLVVVFADSIFNPKLVNFVSRSDGFILLLFFLVFVYYSITTIKNDRHILKEEKPKYKLLKSTLLIIVGLILTILGSNFVVDSAVKIAGILGISERVISILVIAVGTSLPEVVTSIVSNKKGEQDILLGNIVGSNIFNIGIVLALPIAIFGGITGVGFSYIDLAMLVFSALILFPIAATGKKIDKREGILMIIIFIIYNISILVI